MFLSDSERTVSWVKILGTLKDEKKEEEAEEKKNMRLKVKECRRRG
jgi:hypothetical protein